MISYRDFLVFEHYVFSGRKLSQVGEMHNLTTERIRQIVFTVSRKLRKGFDPPREQNQIEDLMRLASTAVSDYWANREANEADTTIFRKPDEGLRFVACRIPHMNALLSRPHNKGKAS